MFDSEETGSRKKWRGLTWLLMSPSEWLLMSPSEFSRFSSVTAGLLRKQTWQMHQHTNDAIRLLAGYKMKHFLIMLWFTWETLWSSDCFAYLGFPVEHRPRSDSALISYPCRCSFCQPATRPASCPMRAKDTHQTNHLAFVWGRRAGWKKELYKVKNHVNICIKLYIFQLDNWKKIFL